MSSNKKFRKEVEIMWKLAKAKDKRMEKEWNALPEEEKERRIKMYQDPFFQRISDNPFPIDFFDNAKGDSDN